jgi:hypothetical protein
MQPLTNMVQTALGLLPLAFGGLLWVLGIIWILGVCYRASRKTLHQEMKITVSSIRDAFKVDLPIEALFTAHTVSTLAELIENAEGRSVDDEFEEGSA